MGSKALQSIVAVVVMLVTILWGCTHPTTGVEPLSTDISATVTLDELSRGKVGERGEREITKEEKLARIRDTFKQLLKVKTLPGADDVWSNAVPQVQRPPPKYMLELYERYRRGEMNGNRLGNTVRSILPMKGTMDGNQILLFNLSGIHLQEEMLLAELHFYKRRKVKWLESTKKPEYRMKLFGARITKSDIQVITLDTVHIPRHNEGWHVYDLTKILEDHQKFGRKDNYLLGIAFQGLNTKLKFTGLPLNKFIKMASLPFLIVFSNDGDNSTIEDLEMQMTDKVLSSDKHFLPRDYNKHSTVNNDVIQELEFDTKRLIDNDLHVNNTHLNFLKRFSRSTDENVIQENNLKQNFGRASRSIFDNELPENSVLSSYIPQTSPTVLQSRNHQKQKQSHIIPYPHTMTFGKHRKKNHQQFKKNRKKHQNRLLPKMWQRQSTIHDKPAHENDAMEKAIKEETDNLCRKRKLLVDFADIGWGEWIISPKSFEAHYCAGSCPFPLSKTMKPSNHATIQSIVHAIGMHPKVPPPCCVADAMSSLTLLYFDEDRNVVLKNYPNMIVESCACR